LLAPEFLFDLLVHLFCYELIIINGRAAEEGEETTLGQRGAITSHAARRDRRITYGAARQNGANSRRKQV